MLEMESLEDVSPARILIEAVRLTTRAEIPRLRQLLVAHPKKLPVELLLRIILSYLPEATEPRTYTGLLKDSWENTLNTLDDTLAITPPTFEDLSEKDARERVREIYLQSLKKTPNNYSEASDDVLTLFLLHRAHKIDSETGSLPLVAELLKPFLDHSNTVCTWAISTLLPLLRLEYEHYPHKAPVYSLEKFEQLDGSAAVNALLSEAAQREYGSGSSGLDTDLRSLVGPWMYGDNSRKRRRLNNQQVRGSSTVAQVEQSVSEGDEQPGVSSWSHVNTWLIDLALRDFPRVANCIEGWNGPGDIDYGDWSPNDEEAEEDLQDARIDYVQAGLASIYATHDGSAEVTEASHRVLRRMARLADLPVPPDLKSADNFTSTDTPSIEYYHTLSHDLLLHKSLLAKKNTLTFPCGVSLVFCYFLLVSCMTLNKLGLELSCRHAAGLTISNVEADQVATLRKVMHTLQKTKIRDEKFWESVRHQILWLRDWNFRSRTEDTQSSKKAQGVFCHVGHLEIEVEILKGSLDAGCYKFATGAYFEGEAKPIPSNVLEDNILRAALASYDNSSNGNKDRGGVRKTAEMITSFRRIFPTSRLFNEVQALVAATHAMSFYSLTLERGVPFQPANIRAHQDPISLIGKILEQNPSSYTKLEDLLEIGRNLIAAGSIIRPGTQPALQPSSDEIGLRILVAERRIIAMAIGAALTEDDFDTAYSYVVNRLAPSETSGMNRLNEPGNPSAIRDDFSWRGAYRAGCYQLNKFPGPSIVRRLEQRMELLSQALLLAPVSALPEILKVWRGCEDEMNVLVAQEAEDEDKWDEKADRRVPGGFRGEPTPTTQKSRGPARAAVNEEAPMGLFDVARGAAAAISKSAFPLRATNMGGSGIVSPIEVFHGKAASIGNAGGSDQESLVGADGEHRVRKRDMVSNMVTGGLASGIGWVIGAPPTKH